MRAIQPGGGGGGGTSRELELQLALGRSGGTASVKTAATERGACHTPSLAKCGRCTHSVRWAHAPHPFSSSCAGWQGHGCGWNFFWGGVGGYCRRDPNGQHLPLWQTFPLFLRAAGPRGWEGLGRGGWSICSRLELHSCPNYYLSALLISPPRPSAAAAESVPSVHWRDIRTSSFPALKKEL